MDDSGVRDPGRRRLFSGLALGGTAVATGVIGGVAGAAFAGRGSRGQLTVDVACIGSEWRTHPREIWRTTPTSALPSWWRGGSTPPGQCQRSGSCRSRRARSGAGSAAGGRSSTAAGPSHTSRQRSNICSDRSARARFAPPPPHYDDLERYRRRRAWSDRTEGNHRGTGKYLGTSGVVRQIHNGVNTTILDDGGDFAAANYIFEFNYWRD